MSIGWILFFAAVALVFSPIAIDILIIARERRRERKENHQEYAASNEDVRELELHELERVGVGERRPVKRTPPRANLRIVQ